MIRVYIVTSDTSVEIATVDKEAAISTFKHCLEGEGIKFDIFAPNVRIRIYSDIYRITYNYKGFDGMDHTLRLHTEDLKGIE